MDKQTGKLLVLGGFALKLCLAGFNYVLQLLAMSKMNFFRTLLRMLTGNFISCIYNLAGLAAIIAVAAGFFIVFCSEKNVFDLALAILFALDLRSPISSIMRNGLSNLRISAVNSSFNYIDEFEFSSSVSTLLIFITAFLWLFKATASGNRLSGTLAYGALIASCVSPVIINVTPMLLNELDVGVALSKLIMCVVLSIPVISAAALTLAAFLDFNKG